MPEYSPCFFENSYLLRLGMDVSCLNKAPLRKLLSGIEDDTNMLIDGSRADYTEIQIIEDFENFQIAVTDHDIRVEFKNLRGRPAEPGSRRPP